MYNCQKLSISFFAILIFCNSLFAQEDKPVKVMVLGTYHMANPGQDAANLKADDVTTPKRQAELEQLASMLAEFNPTKIAIESSFGNSVMNDRYRKFIEHGNTDSLKANESYQIGFRLASKLGHEKIYPIDHRMNIQPASFDSLLALRPDKAKYLQNSIQGIQDSLNYWNENILYKKSIAEFLAFMNSERLIEANYQLYLDFLREMYDNQNYAGAEMLALWHQRNLFIFQNLTRITDFEDPNEKILIVFGQGHAKILKDLIQDADYYEDVNVLQYLSDN